MPIDRDWLDPQPIDSVCVFEVGKDPWHENAFIGTGVEGRIGHGGPWFDVALALDHCGNVIGVCDLNHGRIPILDEETKRFYWGGATPNNETLEDLIACSET